MSTIPQDCVARVATAMGAKADAQTLTYVREQIQKAMTPGPSPADQLQSAALRFQQRAELAAVIQRRNAALNAVIYQRALGYVTTTWAGREAEGLRAMLTGSIEARKGARASVAREQHILLDRYNGGLYTELERAGVRELFASGAADQDVVRALRQLGQQQPNMAGISREAQTIAKVVRKWQEVARTDANAAGAWIGKLDDWIVSQSHDRWKVERAGFQAWAADIGQRLDWPRIEAEHGPIQDKALWLREVYTNIASGVQLKAQGATNTTGFIGPRNVAKGMSQERVLHFRTADDWYAYNQAFGFGSLREAVFAGLRRSAQNTGIMRVLGTNPDAMFNRLVDEISQQLRRGGDEKAIRKFSEATAEQGWLRRRLAEVDGSVNIAVNHTAARVGAGVRAVQSMAKLGGATISSFGDIATYGSEMAFQGRTFLSGVTESLEGLTRGRPKAEARELLAEAGVFLDSMIAELSRAGTLDDSIPGAMTRGLRLFFKANLLSWWTDTLRSSAALGMLHTLAGHRGKAFADLPERLRKVFNLYDIGEADWNVMRAGSIKALDGRDYLTRAGLPQDVGEKLSRYVSDRAYTAVLEPDADARAMMKMGTRPGTPLGEIDRFVMQFKSYGVGFARQVVGREIYGYGPKAFEAGSMQGLAKLIVASTILGYASMTVKEMLKGKKPRDPETPGQWAAVIQAAMVQGGGFGLYGDYLFGQYSRFGGTSLESAAGPALGTAADVLKLFHRAKAGDDAAAAALRVAINNTPFINLFYTRPVLDYAILYEMQEALNPGALRRMEGRIKKESGQEYWLPPSEVVQ